VSNFLILPATKEAAIEVASNLRPDDYREVVEGHGQDPMDIVDHALESHSSYAVSPDGRTAALAGVYDDGCVWMLCTPVIEEYPISFGRVCRRWIKAFDNAYLYNIIDKRNTVHINLIKHLGFTLGEEFEYGPNNLTFIEFYRWFGAQSH
jgi:hypothetical protein